MEGSTGVLGSTECSMEEITWGLGGQAGGEWALSWLPKKDFPASWRKEGKGIPGQAARAVPVLLRSWVSGAQGPREGRWKERKLKQQMGPLFRCWCREGQSG